MCRWTDFFVQIRAVIQSYRLGCGTGAVILTTSANLGSGSMHIQINTNRACAQNDYTYTHAYKHIYTSGQRHCTLSHNVGSVWLQTMHNQSHMCRCGLWVMAGAHIFSVQSLGPLIMLTLFLCVSIPLMEARQLKRRPSAYEQYVQDVPNSFLPMPVQIKTLLSQARSVGITTQIKTACAKVKGRKHSFPWGRSKWVK